MTKLSIFLYLANLFDSIGTACIFIGTLGMLGYCAWFIAYLSGEAVKPSKSLLVTTIFCIILAVVSPSQKTMYMIAGTEAAQTVITSDAGQRILTDVEKKIEQALEENNKR